MLHHSGDASRFIDVEIDEGTFVAAEDNLILGIGLLTLLYLHDGRVVLGYAPVVFLVTIVVDTLVCHVLRYRMGRVCGVGNGWLLTI